MKQFLFFLLLVSLIPFYVAHAATNHALIVGVSTYPGLDESYQLRGPENDATLVRDFLLSQKMRPFQEQHITVLADGVNHAGRPRLANIIAAMDKLIHKAGRGDFIYLHFSGHGSRQPAKFADHSETDGLDELFLPADIGQWDGEQGSVENALTDNVLGQKISAMRQKGAFVWAVFDTCHSGTLTRTAPVGEDLKQRMISPTTLGVPQALMERRSVKHSVSRGIGAEEQKTMHHTALSSTEGHGGFVAFYAAQADQTTSEMRLPMGEEGRKPHGLFTFTLLQIMGENSSITYLQLAQAIHQRYAIANLLYPTPLFEGDLNRPVFGSQQTNAGPPQWPVTKKNGQWHIAAGRLNRLSHDSIMAILTSPEDGSDKALGYARISELESLRSTIKPLKYKGKGESFQMPGHAFARLIQSSANFTVRVAKPAFEEADISKLRQRIATMLAELVNEKNSDLRLQWVEAGDDADIRLAMMDEQLWFLSPVAERVTAGLNRSPSILLSNRSTAEIKIALINTLTRMSRVRNLLHITQDIGERHAYMDLHLYVKRKGEGEQVDLSGDVVPALYPDDIVYITLNNRSEKPVDLNIIYIASDYSITALIPSIPAIPPMRIEPHGMLKQKGLFRVTDSSFGMERLLVIANQAQPESMVLDLSFLGQDAATQNRGNRGKLQSLLYEAGFGVSTTRSIEYDDGATSPYIKQFNLQIRSKP